MHVAEACDGDKAMLLKALETAMAEAHEPGKLRKIAQLLATKHGADRVVIRLEFKDGQTVSVPSE